MQHCSGSSVVECSPREREVVGFLLKPHSKSEMNSICNQRSRDINLRCDCICLNYFSKYHQKVN